MERKYRILLVEDDDDDCQMMSQVVQNIMKHEVIIARDGLEAIRLAGDETFDLVLLDLILPNLQGWDVAETLRQMETYRRVPIIAVTAYDTADTRRRSLESGCNEFLTKPIDIDSFVTVVSEYLVA